MLKYHHLQKNKNAFTPLEITKIKRRHKENKSLTGFTLIEVLTAIFLIVVGVIAAFSIIIQTISYTNLSSSKLIASYLTQEGIEIVRNIRDTNWLTGADWYIGLEDGSWEADYTTLTLTDDYDGDFLYIDGSDGFYKYITTPSPEDIRTKFKRKITITPPAPFATLSVPLKVSVEVTWKQLGKDHKVTAQEYLYNWYKKD